MAGDPFTVEKAGGNLPIKSALAPRKSTGIADFRGFDRH